MFLVPWLDPALQGVLHRTPLWTWMVLWYACGLLVTLLVMLRNSEGKKMRPEDRADTIGACLFSSLMGPFQLIVVILAPIMEAVDP